MMRLEKVLAILGQEQIDGSPAELDALCTRIGDLVRMNGEAWVRTHRERLLREWETIVQMRIIR